MPTIYGDLLAVVADWTTVNLIGILDPDANAERVLDDERQEQLLEWVGGRTTSGMSWFID